jgi:hypothetical protein
MLEPVLDDARDVQARSRQCLQRVRPDLEGDERDGGVLVFHPMARRTESGEELAAGGRDVSTLRGTSREVREASFRHVTPSREAELHDDPGQPVALHVVPDPVGERVRPSRLRPLEEGPLPPVR